MAFVLDSILCGAAFLLAFLLFTNPNKINTKSNRWFAGFIFCVFLLAVENQISNAKLLPEEHIVHELLTLSSFVIAPVFYLSVLYYVVPVKKWRATDYLHFALAALMLVSIIISHLSPQIASAGDVDPVLLRNVAIIFNALFATQVAAYCTLAFVKLKTYQRNIEHLNSSIESINLKWLINVIKCILVMAIVWVLDIAFDLSEKTAAFDILTSLFYVVSLLYITFAWLKQKEVFPYTEPEKEEINEIMEEISVPEQQRKKLLPDEKLEQYKQLLMEFMQIKKPFLDDQLSLLKLASSLEISSHILSYVINTGFGENFYQFINRYRIGEAKALITDPQKSNLSLLGIGFEVGFNSKTVFNTTFKKLTGQTPSEYKKINSQK